MKSCTTHNGSERTTGGGESTATGGGGERIGAGGQTLARQRAVVALLVRCCRACRSRTLNPHQTGHSPCVVWILTSGRSGQGASPIGKRRCTSPNCCAPSATLSR